MAEVRGCKKDRPSLQPESISNSPFYQLILATPNSVFDVLFFGFESQSSDDRGRTLDREAQRPPRMSLVAAVIGAELEQKTW